jgi:hypothetical protein
MNVFYVYAFVDPRKPGSFTYDNYKFDFEPFYIGKGKDSRYKRHLNQSQLNAGNNPHKERVFKKIAAAGFHPTDHVVLIGEQLSEADACQLEQEVIRAIGRSNLHTGPLTNLTDGGEGMSNFVSPCKGKTYEELYGAEKAAQLKEAKSQRFLGDANPMRGVASYWRGKKLPAETRAKISQTRSRRVNQLEKLSGKIVATFPNAHEAAQSLGILTSSIHNCLSPNQPAKSAGGFRWEYVTN